MTNEKKFNTSELYNAISNALNGGISSAELSKLIQDMTAKAAAEKRAITTYYNKPETACTYTKNLIHPDGTIDTNHLTNILCAYFTNQGVIPDDIYKTKEEYYNAVKKNLTETVKRLQALSQFKRTTANVNATRDYKHDLSEVINDIVNTVWGV